jgi:glycosyltransferase involved in cell wall biosynthesis
MESLGILIPVFNEEGSIEKVTVQLISMLRESQFKSFKILIVDDASEDDGQQIIKELSTKYTEVDYHFKKERSNVGESFQRAIQLLNTSYFSWIPADGEIPPSIFKNLSLPNSKEILIHYPLKMRTNRTLLRWILSKTFVKLSNALFGHRLRYYNGTTLYPMNAIKDHQIISSGFTVNLELILESLAQGFKVREVPFYFGKRSTGRTKAFEIKNIISVFSSLVLLKKQYQHSLEKGL